MEIEIATHKTYEAERDKLIQSTSDAKSIFKQAEKGAALITDRYDLTCSDMQELYKLYKLGRVDALFDIISEAYKAGFYRGVQYSKKIAKSK